jgi:lipopolysaccharide export system protein LptA
MRYILALLVLFLFANLASAQQFNKKVEIDSDELQYFTEANKAVFKGNVIASQGDMKLYSNECVVLFEKKGEKSEQNSVKSIELTGKVKIITPKEHIESDKGFYDTGKGTITLIGNVKLFQDKNTLYGDKLVHNVNTGESVITSSGKSRVKAVIIPQEKSGN